MFKSVYFCRGLYGTVASLILLVAACESDNPGASAEQDAARANVEAMAREHADDTTEPSAGVQLTPQHSVVSDRHIAYAEVDDELVYGHFVFPSDMVEPLPAIIMIHEWWGLNDNIRAMADQLAGEGYIVLAVDLFSSRIAASPEAARRLMLSVVERPESATENIRQAFDFVSETAGAPRIASLGWCFGGGWSLRAALLFPDELDAAVIYYGQLTDDEAQLSSLNVPVLGLFGAEDQGITVESVRAFEVALTRLRKSFEIQIYAGAGHAFANPTGTSYNAAAADDAWKRMLEFLGQKLSGSGNDS